MLKWLPAAALLLLASPAVAQQACGPTREVETELERQFQERKIAAGEMKAGGISCVLAVGEGWRVVLAGEAI